MLGEQRVPICRVILLFAEALTLIFRKKKKLYPLSIPKIFGSPLGADAQRCRTQQHPSVLPSRTTGHPSRRVELHGRSHVTTAAGAHPSPVFHRSPRGTWNTHSALCFRIFPLGQGRHMTVYGPNPVLSAVFANKVPLALSHTHLFTHRLRLLSGYNGQSE